MLKVKFSSQTYPVRGKFSISRGSRTEATTLQMEISDGHFLGKSEAVPYARYGESLSSVSQQINDIIPSIELGLSREDLQTRLPAGAARNLFDLALWDLEAKQKNMPVWQLAKLPQPHPVLTAYTLSLNTPEKMAENACQASQYPLLKIKLGTKEDRERLIAIHSARPDAQLIVDANEGWSIKELLDLAPLMHQSGVILCEQPLPVNQDLELESLKLPFLLCADESFHTSKDITVLKGRYQAVNIKLDKTGGLTEALATLECALHYNMQIMVGCMLASSLALAPATLLTTRAQWVDLDAPLLLAADYKPGLDYQGAQLYPPHRMLWG